MFSQYGRLKMFNTKTLIYMAHFMSIEPVTGLNTINNILRLFKVKIDVEAPGVRHITKMIVARELNMYFTQLR